MLFFIYIYTALRNQKKNPSQELFNDSNTGNSQKLLHQVIREPLNANNFGWANSTNYINSYQMIININIIRFAHWLPSCMFSIWLCDYVCPEEICPCMRHANYYVNPWVQLCVATCTAMYSYTYLHSDQYRATSISLKATLACFVFFFVGGEDEKSLVASQSGSQSVW